MEEKEREKDIAQAEYDAFVKNIDDSGKLICQTAGRVAAISAQKGKMIEKGAEMIQLAEEDEKKCIVFEMTLDEKNDFTVGTEFQVTYKKRTQEQNHVQETETFTGIVEKIIYEENENRYVGYGSYSNHTYALEYGEKVKVELKTNGIKYYTIVPISAVTDNDSGKCIYIAREDEKGDYYVKKRKITVLDSNHYQAAIDVNLEYGDKIITSASKSLKDGIQVRLQTEHTEGIHIEQFLKSAGEEAKDYGFCCESKSDIGRRDCNVKKVLVNDAYMQNFSFRLLKGQCLDSFAMENQEHVAMIEEDLACKLFFSSDVLGQNISLDGTDYKIIGVYEDKSISFARDKYTRVYIPYGSAEGWENIRIDTIGILRSGNWKEKLDRLRVMMGAAFDAYAYEDIGESKLAAQQGGKFFSWNNHYHFIFKKMDSYGKRNMPTDKEKPDKKLFL